MARVFAFLDMGGLSFDMAGASVAPAPAFVKGRPLAAVANLLPVGRVTTRLISRPVGDGAGGAGLPLGTVLLPHSARVRADAIDLPVGGEVHALEARGKLGIVETE